VVLTFAGLKGAIGISLAMHVYENGHFDKQVSSLVLFHVTTNSLLTLIIQGLTTNVVVRMLGISTIKRVEYKFFKEYLYSFEALVKRKEETLKKEMSTSFNMVDWESV
jgi:NhaP-type Na+/H+ or K+/H+ antiporter